MATQFPLARMTVSSTGTGTITLNAAVTGFLTFDLAGCSTASAGQVVSYGINDTTQSEAGWGTYYSSTPSLTRGSSLFGLKSTNSNSAINMSNTAQVFLTPSFADLNSYDQGLADTNMVVNPAMEVSQENGSTAVAVVTATAKYIVDQWSASFDSGVMVVSCQQVAPPGSPAFGAAFQSCLQWTATTGDAALAAGEYALISQSIEGYRFARVGFGNAKAQPVSIGFWVYTTIAGTMTVSIRNSALNRSYVTDVAINNATTWEYKVVTIPGDASGTWLTTTGVGARLTFCFGTGTTFQGTNNTWTAGNIIGTSATTNFFASNNNVAAITGVSVVPATVTLSADRSPFLMRPVGMELPLCQRYFESISTGGSIGGFTGYFASTSLCRTGNLFKVTKGTAPTLTGTSSAILINHSGGNPTGTSVTLNQSTVQGWGFEIGVSGTPFTTGQSGVIGIADGALFANSRI